MPDVAGLLLAVEDDLDTGVRLVSFGAEEPGLHGAYQWAATHDLGNVECVVNVDGSGTSGTLRLITNGCDGVVRAFEAVTDRLDAPLETVDFVLPHGDQWPFVQEGVPGVLAASTSDLDGRGWTHTHADTIDKVDPRDLRELAYVIANGVARLADADTELDRRSRETIRAAIDAGFERELKAAGRWQYD